MSRVLALALAPVMALASSLQLGCNDAPKSADTAKSADAPESADVDKGAPLSRREHAKKAAAERAAKGAPTKPTMGPPREVTPSGEKREEKIAELAVSVPKEWETGTPSGPMRMAQFVIPGPGGDAELVVYRFKGGAGGVEDNILRWKKQFVPAEGKAIDDVTTVTKGQVGALATTVVDIAGRYVAAISPGSPEQYDEADWRMLAAIVEGAGDPFFFKAVGPQKTLELWKPAFGEMIESAKAG